MKLNEGTNKKQPNDAANRRSFGTSVMQPLSQTVRQKQVGAGYRGCSEKK
jgi:hypothetical protein